MPKPRTPQAHERAKPKLSESWVVESDGDDDESDTQIISGCTVSNAASPTRIDASKTSKRSLVSSGSPQRRLPRTSTGASAEPDLIMPSIHEDNLDGSWSEEKIRKRKTPIKAYDRSQESEGVLEERSPKKTSSKRSTAGATARSAGVKPRKLETQEGSRTWEFIENIATAILGWTFDVIGGGLVKAKGTISGILAVCLVIYLLIFLRTLLFSSVYSALSPICKIPGASRLHLPMCSSEYHARYSTEQPPPVPFDSLMTVQSKYLGEILDASADGASLPLEMKRGESSIRDLREKVRYSPLRSRNELVLEFDGFVATAKIASADLQRFNSHVGRAVDNILATNRWTRRVLDDISLHESSRGALARFFSADNTPLAPFQPRKFTKNALTDQYIKHTRVIEDEIHRLVAEAHSLLAVLTNLEDRLDVIHGIALRDDSHTQTSREEVLSQLWTKLGGNGRQMAKFDSELRLLSQVNVYRQTAIAQVSGTIVKLQAMGSELEELRERVGKVELLDGMGVGGVPLSVHIENIELGVERLEEGRERAQRIERGDPAGTIHDGGGREIEG